MGKISTIHFIILAYFDRFYKVESEKNRSVRKNARGAGEKTTYFLNSKAQRPFFFSATSLCTEVTI